MTCILKNTGGIPEDAIDATGVDFFGDASPTTWQNNLVSDSQ